MTWHPTQLSAASPSLALDKKPPGAPAAGTEQRTSFTSIHSILSNMPPPKKKPRSSRIPPADDQLTESLLLSDHRTAWLVNDKEVVELQARGETFRVSRSVLTKHSEYFEASFNGKFKEATQGAVQFEDDVDPRYLALYIGLAYSHSSIVPHTPPPPAESPEATAPKTPLRDFVEVYKLCDRFISPVMACFIEKCIKTAIGDGHRALFRTDADMVIQKTLMRDFADAYEALERGHTEQSDLGDLMITYFCDGVGFQAWISCMEEVMDRPRFVGHVSRGFASKLASLQGTKLRRKELKGP